MGPLAQYFLKLVSSDVKLSSVVLREMGKQNNMRKWVEVGSEKHV